MRNRLRHGDGAVAAARSGGEGALLLLLLLMLLLVLLLLLCWWWRRESLVVPVNAAGVFGLRSGSLGEEEEGEGNDELEALRSPRLRAPLLAPTSM